MNEETKKRLLEVFDEVESSSSKRVKTLEDENSDLRKRISSLEEELSEKRRKISYLVERVKQLKTDQFKVIDHIITKPYFGGPYTIETEYYDPRLKKIRRFSKAYIPKN